MPKLANCVKLSDIGGVVMRVKVILACGECKQRNYHTMKNIKKYCKFCKTHTAHKETK